MFPPQLKRKSPHVGPICIPLNKFRYFFCIYHLCDFLSSLPLSPLPLSLSLYLAFPLSWNINFVGGLCRMFEIYPVDQEIWWNYPVEYPDSCPAIFVALVILAWYWEAITENRLSSKPKRKKRRVLPSQIDSKSEWNLHDCISLNKNSCYFHRFCYYVDSFT